MIIGGVTGTNVMRVSRYVATANFTLPGATGLYDAGGQVPGGRVARLAG